MTLAAVAVGLQIAGSVYSGISGMQAGNYRAQVALMNKQIAEQNAERAINRSQIEAQNQDAMTLAALGEQTAVQSASGIALDSRSLSLTRKATRELGRLDALNVRQAGELEAYNYRTDAVNFGAEANMARREARDSLVSGFLNAGSSLIGGAGRVKNPGRFAAEPTRARLPRPRPGSLLR